MPAPFLVLVTTCLFQLLFFHATIAANRGLTADLWSLDFFQVLDQLITGLVASRGSLKEASQLPDSTEVNFTKKSSIWSGESRQKQVFLSLYPSLSQSFPLSISHSLSLASSHFLTPLRGISRPGLKLVWLVLIKEPTTPLSIFNQAVIPKNWSHLLARPRGRVRAIRWEREGKSLTWTTFFFFLSVSHWCCQNNQNFL